MPMPVLARCKDRFAGVEADDLLDFLPHAFGVRGGEVDLVDDGDDLVVVLDALIHVGQSLRFNALRRIHDQKRAFAGREASRDFVREIDVPRRVHEVELVALPLQPHRLRLDGDPALALDVHVVEDLGVAGHLAVGEPAGRLDQPVGERRLPMVDMRDDAEIADFANVFHRPRR